MKSKVATASAALVGAVVLSAGAAPAHAATTCTWGGTPAAPTGRAVNTPGVTSTPSKTALRFHATGVLGGGPGCRGTVRFVGGMDKGASCALISFHARVYGLPGVRSVAGTSVSGVAPARLFDRAGNVVGSENAQFLTNAPFSACNTKQGMGTINFSSVIVLLGSGVAPRRANTFNGNCNLKGELQFRDPVGSTPRTTSFTDVGHGTCTGVLNGVSVKGMPVTNNVTGSGELSCAAGHTSTADILTFARRRKIRVFTDAVGGATQFAGHFRGAVSGDGTVHVNLLPYTDQSVLAACQAGALRRVRYDLTAQTVTPMVG